MEAWRSLGLSLRLLVEECERDAITAWRYQLEQVLEVGGASADHPLRALVSSLRPDPESLDFVIPMEGGWVGNFARDRALMAAAARGLERAWKNADACAEDGDAENDLWDDWSTLEPPELPEDLRVRLGELADAATVAAAEPASTWPMFETGELERDVIGQALDDVAERTGIPRAALPAVPASLAEKKVMVRAKSVDVIDELQQWLASREAWARVLGRLALDPSTTRPRKA
jgi:hypothetical protein